MHRARIVMVEDRLLHIFEIFSVSSLVAKRPNAYASMVAIADDHAACTVHDGLRPHRVAARNILAAHTMRFHIAFIHHIKSVFITKFIEKRIVRVMAGTNGVDVRLLHKV